VCRHAAIQLRKESKEAADAWAGRLTVATPPLFRADRGLMPPKTISYVFWSCVASLAINTVAWIVLLFLLSDAGRKLVL